MSDLQLREEFIGLLRRYLGREITVANCDEWLCAIDLDDEESAFCKSFSLLLAEALKNPRFEHELREKAYEIILEHNRSDVNCQHHWKIGEPVATSAFNAVCEKCQENRLFYADSPYDENSRTIRPDVVRKYHGFHKLEKEDEDG